MEIHDGKPVTRLEAWFRKRVFEVPEADRQWLEEDRVELWCVLGVSRDSSYAKRKDDPDSKTRTCIIDIDTVVALNGELRDRAINLIASDRQAELTAEPGAIDTDRLGDYLRSRWPEDLQPDETPTDTAIRLLERLEAIAPAMVVTRDNGATSVHPLRDSYEMREAETETAGPQPWADEVIDASATEIERVGSIYRGQSKTRAVLERAFGDD